MSLTLSFDARDTPALAAAKKSDALKQYARPGAGEGWHFLTGDETAIRRLTEAVGFRYNYESDNDRFGHATGIMLLTPEGKVARYFYGIEFSPRDLRLGLIEASAKKIGSPIDQLLLFCYHYDPATGKYSLLDHESDPPRGQSLPCSLWSLLSPVMLRRDRNRKAAAQVEYLNAMNLGFPFIPGTSIGDGAKGRCALLFSGRGVGILRCG